MKIAITIALTAAPFAAMQVPALKRKKGVILALYALGMILFSIVYNYRTIERILPFYHPKYQTMYQPEFLSNGEYPDAFLGELFRGKRVYTPDDAYEVEDEHDMNTPQEEEFDEHGNYWLYHYYHAINMWEYLDYCRASVVKKRALNEIALTSEQKGHFEDIGPANDMMRYTFPLTPYNGEWGNGFYYYWFYNAFIGDSRIYICPEDITETDDLVCLWQRDSVNTDSYYIASKAAFDKYITYGEFQ